MRHTIDYKQGEFDSLIRTMGLSDVWLNGQQDYMDLPAASAWKVWRKAAETFYSAAPADKFIARIAAKSLEDAMVDALKKWEQQPGAVKMINFGQQERIAALNAALAAVEGIANLDGNSHHVVTSAIKELIDKEQSGPYQSLEEWGKVDKAMKEGVRKPPAPPEPPPATRTVRDGQLSSARWICQCKEPHFKGAKCLICNGSKPTPNTGSSRNMSGG